MNIRPPQENMNRSHYKLFSPASIAGLTIPNRTVRSATWDPCILRLRQMTAEVLDLYRTLALGGVGAIISGGFPVYRERAEDEPGGPVRGYADLRIDGLEKMPEVVHQARPECKIIAQIETGKMSAGPSSICSPLSKEPIRALSEQEIEQVLENFVAGIVDMQRAGFDGVQLHAAHSGFLSRFLSPYTNRREDSFGGSFEKRAAIIRRIVSGARREVGDFPILIKMNCTDYVVGGIDRQNFPALAAEIARAGVDAIEISGGMWDCLVRPAEELGFRDVPTPEAHTRIGKPEQQSYFLPYAGQLDLDIPVILVGGNRDVERLEAIVQAGKVDFIAMCRPLIREPGLPDRWKAGTGGRLPECVSCNSCIYAMQVHPGRDEPALVSCVCKNDKELHQAAQRWLISWKKNNLAQN